jgi:hypothetical protein
MGYELGLTATVTNYSKRAGSEVFTLLLGFVAAWRRYFGPKEASVLNRMVLWFNLLSRFLNGCRVPLETTDKIGTGTSPLENRTP